MLLIFLCFIIIIIFFNYVFINFLLVRTLVANKIFNLILFFWLATAPLFQPSFSAANVFFAAQVAALAAAPVAAPAAALVALVC